MTNNTEILRTEGLKRSYLVNETKIDVLNRCIKRNQSDH